MQQLLQYLLTPWCRVLLEKLTGLQLIKKFPAFHGTRRFITALTSVRHLSLSWTSPIQSIYPHPTSHLLILSAHLRLGLPSGLLPSGFPTKTLYTHFSSPIRATCPVHLILLDFITLTILGEEYKPFNSSLCNLLHSPVTSSFLGPNILLKLLQYRNYKYYTFWVCVCSLGYPPCNAHAPYYHPWPVRLYHIFPYYLMKGTILEKKVIEYKMCFDFLYSFWLKHFSF